MCLQHIYSFCHGLRTSIIFKIRKFFRGGGGKWRRASDSQWDDGVDQQAANGMMALTSRQAMGYWRKVSKL
jgi:hypothetical protein